MAQSLPRTHPLILDTCSNCAFGVFFGEVVGLRFNLKKAGLLVLVCVTIWTQWAAAAELCPEAHAPNDYCAVCHLGVLPFLKVSISVTDAPALLVERLAILGEFQPGSSERRTPCVSRAPPSNPN